MSDDLIVVDRAGPVVTLTLNRPSAMNALSADLRSQLHEICQQLSEDESAHVVILTGAGEKAFCAGLDLRELGSDPAGLQAATSRDPRLNPVCALDLLPIPLIVAVNGVAITGGFELALAGDILIGSNNARFADTHGRVGILPGWGLSQKLPRIIGQSRASEMSFTGQFIDATRAHDWGLLNHVYDPAELLPAAQAMALEMAAVDRAWLVEYKSLLRAGMDRNFADGMALEEERCNAWNAGVTPVDIEERRLAVIERGRKLKGG